MKKTDERSNLIFRLLPVLLWILIWQLAALFVGSDLILPGPVSTARALAGLVMTERFWLDVLWTLIRVSAGALVSFLAGSLCAVIANRNKAVRDFLRIPVSFFKSIPVMAIIIYVILIVKADWVAVIVCFFMCFPIAYTNILNGLTGLDSKYLELSKIYDMTEWQMVSLIIRPALQPEIKAASNLISGMSWKVVVAAEVLAIPDFSIGYQMLNSKYYLDTPGLFAYIVVLIVLSLLMEKAVSYIVSSDYRKVGKRLRKEIDKCAFAGTSSDAVKVTLDGVSKSFGSEDGTKSTVISDMKMVLEPGITAILGPSGRGKTTIMKMIAGLEAPDSGRIAIDPSVRPDVLFQEDRLLPWLTAGENMRLAFLNRKSKEADMNAEISAMAEKLETYDYMDMMPEELSGGMAHRIALGRALISGSPLLMLDEPMRGLDEDLKNRVIENIKDDVRNGRGGSRRTVLLITHDEKLAEDLSDSVIRM